MELTELQEALDEIRPDESEASESIALLMTKLGQMAEGKIKLGSDAADELPAEAKEAAHRDLLAGVVVACVEYAAEYDVDLEQAIEERLEKMREMKEQRAKIKEAMESGDAKALAEALDADANEVPTGMFEDDEDDDDLRGFA